MGFSRNGLRYSTAVEIFKWNLIIKDTYIIQWYTWLGVLGTLYFHPHLRYIMIYYDNDPIWPLLLSEVEPTMLIWL